MRAHWTLATGTIVSLGLAALPASAAAGTAGTRLVKSPQAVAATTPFEPCYTSLPAANKGISPVVGLNGGTPNDGFTVNVTTKGNNDSTTTGTFDANGDASVTLSPIVPTFSTRGPIAGVPTTVTVTDTTAGTPAQQIGSFLVTQIGLAVSSKPIDPNAPRAFAFSGLYPRRVDYGFITNDAGTKVLRKFRIGRSNVCGYIKSRKVIAPAGARRGTYRFYIYGAPKLDKRFSFYTKFKIYRRF